MTDSASGRSEPSWPAYAAQRKNSSTSIPSFSITDGSAAGPLLFWFLDGVVAFLLGMAAVLAYRIFQPPA